MKGLITRWLPTKWKHENIELEDRQRLQRQRCEQYRATFASPSGQLVLNELLDAYYCTALDSTATLEQLAFANGQRFVVQKILETIDEAEHPGKYEVKE